MKKLLFALFLVFSTNAFSQVSDSALVANLFSHNTSVITSTLDSMKIYYHLHKIITKKDMSKQIIISIANSNNSLKLFTIKTFPSGNIEEIVINFNHEIYQNMVDLDNLKLPHIAHVGHYSTDVVLFSPEALKIKFRTKQFDNFESASKYAAKLPNPTIYIYDYIYYVGIVQKEDSGFVYFIDGKGVSKDKLNLIKINSQKNF